MRHLVIVTRPVTTVGKSKTVLESVYLSSQRVLPTRHKHEYGRIPPTIVARHVPLQTAIACCAFFFIVERCISNETVSIIYNFFVRLKVLGMPKSLRVYDELLFIGAQNISTRLIPVVYSGSN